jgi:hypothetical protein
MPILVSCPSCKKSFQVSDQFAGKQGPCPNCKTPIKIPKPDPAKTAATPSAPGKQPAKLDGKPGVKADPAKPAIAAEDIKIHAPETVGPKTSTGRPVVRPVLRKETKVEAVPVVIIVASTLLAFAAAWIMRKPLGQQIPLRAIALLLVSPPLALGGYWFLRDDELEPYRGRALSLRAGICALVYAALWGGYLLLPTDATADAWSWIYLGPPFFLVGAGIAYLTLDLEIGNAFFHYCFYVLVTMLLGYTAGLHMPWQTTKPTRGLRTAAVDARVGWDKLASASAGPPIERGGGVGDAGQDQNRRISSLFGAGSPRHPRIWWACARQGELVPPYRAPAGKRRGFWPKRRRILCRLVPCWGRSCAAR